MRMREGQSSHAPTIHLCHQLLPVLLLLQVFDDPSDEVVLERAFDKLMEDVRRQKFVDICAGKVGREWMKEKRISVNAETDSSPR